MKEPRNSAGRRDRIRPAMSWIVLSSKTRRPCAFLGHGRRCSSKGNHNLETEISYRLENTHSVARDSIT
ncbi:unnamed protein product [Clavelina lepadiformis]|uniref:Uncharacterized protein n=1 Tax=Clavelina lepadiformis TaxID=159417 RepID=A0ABP0GV20_CLALP